MGKIYDAIRHDVRFIEGVKSCMGCGICTAICPAAEFYDYDPRVIVTIVASKNEEKIEELLQSNVIWYCGQCMSCKTRCPRNNCPGQVISVLRKVSQELGYFTESSKGRQQLAIKRKIGETILNKGYCIHPQMVTPEEHPEQGPVWDWIYNNREAFYERMNGNLDRHGAGTLRKIHEDVLKELHAIFEETGGLDLFQKIEEYSEKKAGELGLNHTDDNLAGYLRFVMEDSAD